MGFQKIKNWEDKSLIVETRNYESGIKIFESGLKKILWRNSRNSRIDMKKFSNLEKEVPKIR